MPQSQMLLFPDPRPLVERLGPEFFRGLPETPGIYLMRGAEDVVLYVGKARNLRRRLGSYRVANPDRMAARHLRLVRAVRRIEFQECEDEAAALAMEARLLRALRPKFNRAGTWAGPPRFLVMRVAGNILDLDVATEAAEGWQRLGSMRGAVYLRNALVRLIWRALHDEGTMAELPHGWSGAGSSECRRLHCGARSAEVVAMIDGLGDGRWEEFKAWAQARAWK